MPMRLYRFITHPDRRHARNSWCADTRPAQFFLVYAAILVSLALLSVWLGWKEPYGSTEVLFTKAWGLLPVLALFVLGCLHFLALQRSHGCNWFCWFCCTAHCIFWAWVFLFTKALGYWGFPMLFLATSGLALWASLCVIKPLEQGECEQ